MTNPKIIYTNKTEIAALKAVGARLKEAREFLKLTQTHAAPLLETSGQALIDAESGRLNPLPIKFLKAAAETYSVSVDWLLGLVEWEREDAGRDLLAGLQRIHLKHYAELVARQAEADENNGRAQAALAEIVAAFEVFIKSNPDFEDMPAGARLLRAVSTAKNSLVAQSSGNKQTLSV
ncbi:helix-turn-helix transcriptional regulator [Methylomonas sp. MED-D]|uniref:helix-turn-helix transcriptional regulator n=1 Tax=unclassified Methylomonas TaxID=2608980 RepID=UPI0028A487B5|nr:helix-turn-helix transcriptional regulator [Methylomonas sp. MV1]MDT4330863.1 helix-turn-helix transcriptional regulator [Methylomonas sp. MV1]